MKRQVPVFTLKNAEPTFAKSNYRYRLERGWGKNPSRMPCVCFVLCNPSNASREINDPTVDACAVVASMRGYKRMVLVNLFARRCPNSELLRHKSTKALLGKHDEAHWKRALSEATEVCVAWGNVVTKINGWRSVFDKFWQLAKKKPVFCIKQLKGNHPAHPARKNFHDLSNPTQWMGYQRVGARQ